MKYLKIFCFSFFALTIAVNVSACGNEPTANTEKQGKEYTSAYICPMHCDGSGSAESGTCPVCGMDYVLNEDHKSDGHTH